MAFWSIPKIWTNSTCHILGGGPSISTVDIGALQAPRSHTIAVNNTYQLAPWADFLYFMDKVWFQWHKEELEKFQGVIICGTPTLEHIPFIHTLKRGKSHYYDPRPDRVSYGHNAGHGAICVAVSLGAKRIILYGFDMRIVNGEPNYHSDHKRVVPVDIYKTQYFNSFKFLAEDLEELGVAVINATPGSALPYFPIVSPEEALACWQ